MLLLLNIDFAPLVLESVVLLWDCVCYCRIRLGSADARTGGLRLLDAQMMYTNAMLAVSE